ncbi:MAG: DUF3047 domain-containing protein [Opitutaceae bacterium]
MTRRKYRIRLLLGAVLGLAAAARTVGADLFDGFSGDWRARWREEKFFTKPTHYAVVLDAGVPVLHAVSQSAHAGLVRAVSIPAPTRAILAWDWKIRTPLEGNTRERERAGDDYAARVFVVFETSVIPLRTRAINYVWSAYEPVGATYPSPYTRNVGMVVIRSGAAEAGKWCDETRDVLADYHRHFGEPATRISAVAVLVDTDNTHGEAEAWFARLSLETTPPVTLAP